MPHLHYLSSSGRVLPLTATPALSIAFSHEPTPQDRDKPVAYYYKTRVYDLEAFVFGETAYILEGTALALARSPLALTLTGSPVMGVNLIDHSYSRDTMLLV